MRAWLGGGLAFALGVAFAQEMPQASSSGSVINGYAEVLSSKAHGRRAAGVAAAPYAPIKRLDDEGHVPEIEMFVGESRVFPSPGVARIAVGNGQLLTAAALDNKEVILFANGAGTSSLFVWNADGRYQRVKVNIVPGDTTRYAREIAAFLSTIPKARASIVGPNIIVEGDELSDADLSKIEELAKRYPQIVNFTNRVGWEQMVMLDVKVVEFPRNVMSEMGIRWTGTGGGALGGIWGPVRRGDDGPYEIQIRTGTENAPPITGGRHPSTGQTAPLLVPKGLNVLSAFNMGLNAQLNLLAQEGKAAILAEPQLSTRSGSKADFLAGGEIPYSVVTRDGVHIQFKQYGVQLAITPKVDHRGVVRATIMSEVSSIDRSVSTSTGPALLTRRTNTEFNVRAGETIVLAGLLQRDVGTDVDKLPFLGDIPVLGALFRSKRFQNKETELVVFVTPTVVDAKSPGMVDRIQRTQARLQERTGEPPFLTEPLQPGVRYERPDALPVSAAEPPSTTAEPVTVGQPLPRAEPVSVHRAALTSGNPLGPQPERASTVSGAGSPLRVLVSDLSLRSEPDHRYPSLLVLAKDAVVQLGPEGLRLVDGMGWRHVVVGSLRGWVPAAQVEPARGEFGMRAAADAVAQQDRAGKPARAEVLRATGGRAVTAPNPSVANARLRIRLDRLPLRVAPDVNAGVVAQLLAGDIVDSVGAARAGWLPVKVSHGSHVLQGWVAAQWVEPADAH